MMKKRSRRLPRAYDFKSRDQATRALEKYRDQAEPFLRKALETENRLEPRRRLEALLKKAQKK